MRGIGESNQAVEKLKERIAFLEIENKKLSQMHRNEKDSFSKTKVEGEVSASDTWSHTIIAEASDLDDNGISKIMLFEEQLKEAERENKILSDQIKSLQNAGSRNNASKAGSMLESKYNELNRQYKNILDEHNALKAEFDLRVDRKVEVAVGEYKKAMIEVVQSQASNVNRDKKKLIKDAIERERRMSTIKIDEMRESVARETFIAMKSDAVVEGREAILSGFGRRISHGKNRRFSKTNAWYIYINKGEEEAREGMKQLAIKNAVANAQRDILKDSNAEHEILLLEQRANFESQINVEAEGYEKQIINLREKADIEITKARGDAKEFEIKLGEAIKEIKELKKKEISVEEWKIEEKKVIKKQVLEEVEEEHSRLTQLAVENIIEDLEKEKEKVLFQKQLEIEKRMQKQHQGELTEQLHRQKELHDLALKALEQKLLHSDHYKLKHEELEKLFNHEITNLSKEHKAKNDEIESLKKLVGVLEGEKKDLASLSAGDKEHIMKLEEQVRDTMKKVKDARAHAKQKAVECGSLRKFSPRASAATFKIRATIVE